MEIYQIVEYYRKLMAKIEEEYASLDLPREVQHYYILCTLITVQSLERFYKQFPGFKIDVYEAECGKVDYLNLGPLTRFEQDTIEIWSEYLIQRSRHHGNLIDQF
jgi:hypothetical protein